MAFQPDATYLAQMAALQKTGAWPAPPLGRLVETAPTWPEIVSG